MVRIAVPAIITLFLLPLTAQNLEFHGKITGTITGENKKPLEGVQVWLIDEPNGAVSDAGGEYTVFITYCGEHFLVFDYVGYASETLKVECGEGRTVKQDLILRETAVFGDEIRVEAHREQLHAADEIQTKTVIPLEAAQKAGAKTLGDVLQLDAGVKLQTKCSMCSSSEISIQGLPGRFSLVLFDGMPVLSGMASKYVLSMFPSDFMDKVEVVKGAAGAKYGSGALSGAVNIVPPQPSLTKKVNASLTMRAHNSSDAFAAWSAGTDGLSFAALAARAERGIVDNNNDNISENVPHLRNIYLGVLDKSFDALSLNFGGIILNEERKAGLQVPDVELSLHPDAEKVISRQWNIWHQTRFATGKNDYKLRLAYSSSNEDGTMNTRNHNAQQQNFFSELSGHLGITDLVNFDIGTSFFNEKLSDTRLFDDYSNATYSIWLTMNKTLPQTELFAAARFENCENYGSHFSPFAGVSRELAGWNVTLSAGTGYRTPSVIFESLSSVPANFLYVIRRDANLKEETSISTELAIKKPFFTEFAAINFSSLFFRHYVTNFISSRLDGIDSATSKAIFLYYNESNTITSTGSEFSASASFAFGLNVNIGLFALLPVNDSGNFLPFINRWGTNITSTYSGIDSYEFTAALRLNGEMLVESLSAHGDLSYFDAPTFAIVDCRAKKSFGAIAVECGLNNIGNYYQKIDSGEHAHTTEYFWGPLIGREFYAGISVHF